MLGVSGLRGIVGESLTPEVALRYAATVGTYLFERLQAEQSSSARREKAAPRVVLGYDGRPGGSMILDAVLAGLKSTGCHVANADIVMTPTLGVLVDDFKADAGVQVTASHNPQEWNGVKVLLRAPGLPSGRADACAPPDAVARLIVDRFRAGLAVHRSWADVGNKVFDLDGKPHARLLTEALEELGVLKSIRRQRIRVLIDCVNGAGGMLAPEFLDDDMRCRVSALGIEPGTPFWHAPEPTKENLKPVIARSRRVGAAVTFCQDPDADRLAILDERGRYIGEEYTLVLAALALAELGVLGKGSTLAVNLSTSRMIEDLADRCGARVLRTPVGEANVAEAMKRHGCVLGGEGNGGVIWPRITYIRDSLSAMALILALMARTKQPISELRRLVPSYTIEKRKLDLPRRDDALPALARVRRAFAGRPIDEQDGLRVEFDHAWLHVRPSNTEPILRLIAEAPTARQARALLDDALEAMRPSPSAPARQ